MGWASRHIERLRAGETVVFRPHGQSMRGRIESGQRCTVEPVEPAALAVGDVVLCRVNANGWTTAVYGRCVKVEA